jgi:hypothetical protein
MSTPRTAGSDQAGRQRANNTTRSLPHGQLAPAHSRSAVSCASHPAVGLKRLEFPGIGLKVIVLSESNGSVRLVVPDKLPVERVQDHHWELGWRRVHPDLARSRVRRGRGGDELSANRGREGHPALGDQVLVPHAEESCEPAPERSASPRLNASRVGRVRPPPLEAGQPGSVREAMFLCPRHRASVGGPRSLCVDQPDTALYLRRRVTYLARRQGGL